MAGPSDPNMQEAARKMGEVVARAWSEDDYRERLLAAPGEVLNEAGIPTPEGVELRVVENTESVTYITLPAAPSEDLSDDALEAVAGGSTAGSASTAGTVSSFMGTLGSIGTVGTAGSA